MYQRILGVSALAVLTLGIATGGAMALDRHVRIHNNTSYTIQEFYASNVGADTWEEDILGSGVLESGYSVVINIDDASGYCKYDFKAVFNDGTDAVKKAVNVCKVTDFNFTD